MERKKLYEVECHRTNISPKSFYTYCRKQVELRTNGQVSLDCWLDRFEDWETPLQTCNIRNYHEDWDEPTLEICKVESFDRQMYLEGAYNFIMEWFDGNGYMYMVEFER